MIIYKIADKQENFKHGDLRYTVLKQIHMLVGNTLYKIECCSDHIIMTNIRQLEQSQRTTFFLWFVGI